MLTYQEARYIVTEITRRQFYRDQLYKLNREIRDLDEKKVDLSSPNCPQGHETIGQRGNEVTDFSKRLVAIVTRQEEVIRQRDFFLSLLVRATDYYEILMDGEEPMYVRDYFEAHDKRLLEAKYSVSNAYDRMVRIIRNDVQRL